MDELLHNIVWATLAGPQARFAVGTDTVRRYAPGFSPIVGCATPHAPDWEALAPFFAAGEQFYIDTWTGPAPAGWRVDVDATMVRMVWDGGAVDEDPAPEAVSLQPAHFAAALALARLTNPGPFGPRTPELGEYVGIFDDGRLVAMAGERMQAGTLREISGVCTDPAFQGRGFARRLMLKLVQRQQARGETTFLHVMTRNTTARTLYGKMGFRDWREVPVRVVTRL